METQEIITETAAKTAEDFPMLKLENQLCFPLYAASREVIRRYRPFLDALDLTYTQYIALMVLWETDGISVKSLGEKLLLDSGTLTPMLKSMEQKGLVERKRDGKDERVLRVFLTEEGRSMQERAAAVPGKIASCIPLNTEEAAALYLLLYKLLAALKEEED